MPFCLINLDCRHALYANVVRNSFTKMTLQSIIGLITIPLILCGVKEKDKRDIYEIPSGYRGIVIIYKEEACGQKIKKKAGQQIIKIPTDGILIIDDDKLKFPYNLTDRGQELRHSPNVYYEVDKKNRRTELPDLQEKEFEQGQEQRFSKDDIGVFHKGFGSGQTYFRDTISYSFYTLFIGSYNDLKADKYHIDSMKKNRESLDKLRKCRGL
jgi:hypothetical protein